ncbi:solute carrier organic anion transporter family member 5A1-like [Paramacrobiotus metropolitanus]|uniref:solute carrier organic anion transporter family member 5A1-like n=1 Tax=Paramacrobiotus metropolitanus TaxID=2943436 RepID=UPI0024464A3D|nr:solute carrier organic anion transporter family member 5A1-like [Paramacrobiotus metropolitanus]
MRRMNFDKKEQGVNSYLTASEVDVVLFSQSTAAQQCDKDRQCSCFSYSLPCLQKLANVKMFTALCSLTLFVQSALTSGYTCAVLTTIEKKFEMRSVSMGLVVSAYEAGNLLTILFVGYYGCRQRIPAWLGFGSLLMSTGSAIMLVPHLIKIHYYRTGYVNTHTHEFNWHVCPATSIPCEKGHLADLPDPHWLYSAIFVAAQFLCGIGMGPMVSLGATYIDDHVLHREAATFYLSFVYAGAALGPVFGYALGALTLTFDIEHFLSDDPHNMSMDMESWSGAWWGGYLLFAVVLLQVSWMMCLFPKTLPSGRHNDAPGENGVTSCSLRGMGEEAVNIIRNKYFLLINSAAGFQCAIVGGFCLFLPKYIESQFYVSKSVAGLLTGGVAVPAATMGIVCGGWVTRRWAMTPLATSKHIARVAVGTVVAFAPLFFIHCSPDPPIGIGITLRNVTLMLPEFLPERGFDLVEQSACMHRCNCSPKLFQPVCDTEKQTSYSSPCIAGCRRTNHTFLDCACSSTKIVHEGLCGMKCLTTLVIFSVVIFCIAFLAGNTHLPVVFLTMRAVPSDSKSLALALQMVCFRLLAYVPAPMLFGSLIDLTCVLWAETTCEEDTGSGSCLFYDLDAFHRNYACVAFALQVVSTCFFWLNYYVMKRDPQLNVEVCAEDEDSRKELRARISTAVALQPMKGALIGLSITGSSFVKRVLPLEEPFASAMFTIFKYLLVLYTCIYTIHKYY